MSASERLYHNPHCSKSRGALELLRERGVVPEIVAYVEAAPSVEELRGLLRMLGVGARGILRTGEPEYTRLNLADASMDDEGLLAAMHAHPRLIERPIFVRGDRAIIGRPPERVLELLD